MPNWNRIIVGDAFKLPSRNPRFYVDLILMFPTLVAGLWFFSCFHGWRIYPWDLNQACFSGLLLCVFLLLVKERTIVTARILGFLGCQNCIGGSQRRQAPRAFIAFLRRSIFGGPLSRCSAEET